MAAPRAPLKPTHYLALAGRRRLMGVMAGGLVLVLLGAADQRGLLLYDAGTDLPRDAQRALADLARYDGQWVQVVSVIDGDTLRIDLPDAEQPTTRVRLWGIDTPERERRLADGTVLPAKPWADQAFAFADDLVGGGRVRLKLVDTRTRGDYGRVLAYVEMTDGTLLNERLLEAGLARAVDRWEHPLAERFGLIELQARRDRAGLWSGAESAETADEDE